MMVPGLAAIEVSHFDSHDHPRDFPFRVFDQECESHLATGLEGKRVVVQGLGNVGYHAAKFLQEDGGAVIVGASVHMGRIVCWLNSTQ